MSSTLRLSIIMVFLLATTALGLIAYNINRPKVQVAVVQVTEKAPASLTVGYYVAAHPLPRGTLARDEDFTVRSVPSGSVPTGAILDTPDAKIGLRGSLVRNFLDTGSLVTPEDILRPRERGFLASVLAPDSRAISINVDAASGVSGLIWPGDYVDVVLTQESTTAAENKDPDQQHGTLSETVVQNVRVVAIDQEIVQGGPASNAAAGKVAHTVSLQLAPEQVKKVTVAGQRGKLTLAVRSAIDRQDTGDTDTTVTVYARNNGTKYSVKKDDAGNTGTALSGDVSPEIADQSATVVLDAGRSTGDRGRSEAAPFLASTAPAASAVVYARKNGAKYSVKKDDTRNTRTVLPLDITHQSATVAPNVGKSSRVRVREAAPIVALSAPGASAVSSVAKGGSGER